ncbi:TonB-dependent receptor [Lewinellaceae bacterium SD302]|nr:TonB-dependent receptor [Lewinellaceae bacterium SD302]
MKNIYTLFLLFFTLTSIMAQETLSVSGTVLDGNSGEPVEFASVLIANKADGSALGGTNTDPEGNFSLDVDGRDFYVEVSFLGYESVRIDDISINGPTVELGEIILGEQSTLLEEVTVRAEKSQTEFKLDKRIFNVGKDLSSTGASALEVLNNVPSVNVDIEGQVSLRGATGVQILINGKPSVLADEGSGALGTITADMIESIEVVTNPSAKYEAEGTAGIINIIIKKDERKGFNGAVSVNTGTPHNHSVGLSLNRRTEKFNLFSQLGVGYREIPSDRENVNRDLVNGTTLFSEGQEFRNEQFYNLVLGTDYEINPNNIITVSGNFAYEIEDQPSETNFRFQEADGSISSEWQRTEVTEATNPKYQFEVTYKRDFEDDKDHDLIFSAIGTLFSKDQESEFMNETIAGAERDARQLTRTEFGDQQTTFKLDYTKPFNDKFSIETGAQYVLKDVENDFAVSDFINNEFVPNLDFTNVFEYQQNVLGVYGSAAYELGAWGFKAGVRVENTDLSTELVTTGEENNQNFTNLFPSGFISYKFSDAVSVQAGYSRRINRPNLWRLNPFFNIRNNFNIRTGNPNLLPEFTDSYEVNSIFITSKASFNFGVYHRYTTEVVENISRFEDNVTISSPFNIGTQNTTGLEFNMKYTVTKWLTINGDANYNAFSREGQFDEIIFDFSADQYSGKLNTKFGLPYDLDFELTGQYRSSVETVQGTVSDNYFLDLGARKKLFGGRGAVSFAVRDVFATRIRESNTFQPEFETYSFSQRGTFVTLGLSYGFGKGDTMEYSGQRRRF